MSQVLCLGDSIDCDVLDKNDLFYSKNPLIRKPFLKISLFCFLYKGVISRNSLNVSQFNRNFSIFGIFISCF